MTQFTIKIEAPEIAEAISNLAVAVTRMLDARAEAKAEVKTEQTIAKAAKKSSPVAGAAGDPAAGVATPPSVEPSSADKSEIQKLASAKSKVVGVEKVKAAIATFGGKNINETPADKLAELKVALEALV